MRQSRFKQITAVFMVLTLITGILFTPGVCVYAAGATAANLQLDGTTARWTAPSSSDISNYNLVVLKNGEVVTVFMPSETSVDLKKTLDSNGSGIYSFIVIVCYNNGDASEQVTSDEYIYESTHVHKVTHHSFQYPTCTEIGNKEYYECEECGSWFWDSNCKFPVEGKTEVMLEAYGHDWGEWVLTKEPTATENGYESRICNNDPEHIEVREIPATGEETASSEVEPASSDTGDVSEPEPSSGEAEVSSEPESSELPESSDTAASDNNDESSQVDDAQDTSSVISSSGNEGDEDEDAGLISITIKVKPINLILIILASVVVISIIILIIIAAARKKSGYDDNEYHLEDIK